MTSSSLLLVAGADENDIDDDDDVDDDVKNVDVDSKECGQAKCSIKHFFSWLSAIGSKDNTSNAA